ncbi:hypothetical protein J5W90_002242, partial [Salmonella enterica]|nr:hypothetical protein [Salmonella enterica]EGO4986431.1 hypothetical protein [Salmonella enterica]EHG7286623.1 hypothetical protein [Salmonella enterica]
NKIFEIKATKQKSQVNNDSILFSLEELYSAINYLETNSLKEKFKYKKRNKYLKLELDSESAEWLLNHAFKELSQFYREKKEVGNYHLESFKNALYLLAFSDECHNDKTLIYRELIGLVSGDYNQLDFIDCITEYVTICFNNKREMDLDFIRGVMNGLIENYSLSTIKQRGYYNHILSSARNIFIIANELGLSFDNHALLKQLLSSVNDCESMEKIRTVETIIHELFIVGDDLTKKMIKEFIGSLDIDQFGHDKKIKFKLFLLAANIIEKDDRIANDTLTMIKNLSKNKFSSELYSVRNTLEFLVNNKEMQEFSESYEEIKKLILLLENKYLSH